MRLKIAERILNNFANLKNGSGPIILNDFAFKRARQNQVYALHNDAISNCNTSPTCNAARGGAKNDAKLQEDFIDYLRATQ